jgi:hypothetical protein
MRMQLVVWGLLGWLAGACALAVLLGAVIDRRDRR